MKKLIFTLMLVTIMLFGSAALAERVVLPDPGYYFGRVYDGYIIKFDEYPKAEFDAYTALLINTAWRSRMHIQESTTSFSS